eukprot:COSAG03_NODE_3919_length_1759_cov_3.266265_1_plen_205_part_00
MMLPRTLGLTAVLFASVDAQHGTCVGDVWYGHFSVGSLSRSLSLSLSHARARALSLARTLSCSISRARAVALRLCGWTASVRTSGIRLHPTGRERPSTSARYVSASSSLSFSRNSLCLGLSHRRRQRRAATAGCRCRRSLARHAARKAQAHGPPGSGAGCQLSTRRPTWRWGGSSLTKRCDCLCVFSAPSLTKPLWRARCRRTT